MNKVTNAGTAGRQKLGHKRPADFDRFWFGAAYYPEHWNEATRCRDPERMAAAGFNMVRMAEFAWALMEPVEGTFDFTLFDDTIARLGEKGIKTLLCTPTAAPPRWLTRQHPDTLRVNADGVALAHGSRQQCCHASPVFRKHSRRITQAMADHFRGNRHVVGWQTDNEFHCHFSECHCPSCQRGFQEFLRGKFKGDIGALNQAWGTIFWSLTYASFEEIATPRPGKPTFTNPAHELDYHRYLSDAVTRFQHDQVEILRTANPQWWLTHNGLFSHIDYRGAFSEDLNVLGYDSYPMFCYDPVERPARHAFCLDRARAWTGNFIIPEMQSGPGGQASFFQDHPEPGELRKMTYAAVARGADALLYFRWRSCRFGAEEYWCGILDHDDRPRRRFDEVQRVGMEMKRIGPAILGTHVAVEVGIAAADAAVNAAHQTLSFGLPGADDVTASVHQAFYERGYAVGLVHPADDLAGVKLYVVPHWEMFDPAWVPALERYVREGGVLVVGARTASRNLDNNVVPETVPGCLRELAGVTVEEYGRQNLPGLRPLVIKVGGQGVTTQHWYEGLRLDKGTLPLAKWASRHVKGQAAVSFRRVGKGAVVYVGSYLTPELTKLLLPVLVKQARLKPQWPSCPEGVEVVQRQAGARRVWFFINHRDTVAVLSKLPRGQNLLTGKRAPVRGKLAARDVLVLEEK
jgi:beta-galactosidase